MNMSKLRIARVLSALSIVATMALSACGGETPAAQPTAVISQPTAQAQATDTAEIITEPTALATDTAAPPVDEITPVEATPSEAASTPVSSGNTGDMVADLGFRPEVNGFKFENYGKDPTRSNMAPADVRRMFGDQVCASLQGETCILTPAAQQWMDNMNVGMNGGHCEGFAALSLIFYNQKESPEKFGAAKVNDLTIDGNEALQREIAYYFATQATDPTASNEVKGRTPTEILDILIDAMKPGANATATYTMGIYKPGFKGGHAITP